MGLWEKLKDALKKSRDKIVKGFKDIFKRREYDESFWEDLEETLILADVGPETSERIVSSLRKKLKRIKSVDELEEAIVQELLTLLEENKTPEEDNPFYPLVKPSSKPLVVMILGVNGTGKTSFAVKLAKYYKDKGLKPIIGACDTYRVAAIDQLVEWSQRVGVEVIRQFQGADAAAVAYDTVNAARSRGYDIAILDTAGRLHTRDELMRELKKMDKVLKKLDPDYPHEKLLVLDGTFGLNSLRQTRIFHQEIGTTGIVITKLDTSSKAGFVLSIRDELKVPIKFISIGERMTDIQPFDPEGFIRALLARDEVEMRAST